MAADISGLSNLQAGEPLDFDTYVDAREIPPPPRKGRYLFEAPQTFVFDATAAGFLRAQVDPKIVSEGPAKDQTIRYTRLSAKSYKRGKATVSQTQDFLRACGSPARPSTPQEIADAIQACAGALFEAEGDWEAYDKVSKETVKGEENFPKNEAGEPIPWIASKVQTNADGTPVQLRANFRITRFIPKGV